MYYMARNYFAQGLVFAILPAGQPVKLSNCVIHSIFLTIWPNIKLILFVYIFYIGLHH